MPIILQDATYSPGDHGVHLNGETLRMRGRQPRSIGGLSPGGWGRIFVATNNVGYSTMVDAMTDAGCSIMVVDAMSDLIARAFCFFSFDKVTALIALLISFLSFGFSYYFWRKTFRPIVTVMVKTAGDDDRKKVFKLQILNSGSLPAKNIRLWANQNDLEKAFGNEASKEGKTRWVAFLSTEENIIDLLQNNASMSCAFGYTKENGEGFWKYAAKIPITIKYESWFGKRLWFGKYKEAQEITIVDSESFTSYLWGKMQ